MYSNLTLVLLTQQYVHILGQNIMNIVVGITRSLQCLSWCIFQSNGNWGEYFVDMKADVNMFSRPRTFFIWIMIKTSHNNLKSLKNTKKLGLLQNVSLRGCRPSLKSAKQVRIVEIFSSETEFMWTS